MPITVNGVEVTPLVNGEAVEKVTMNGTEVVWEKGEDET